MIHNGQHDFINYLKSHSAQYKFFLVDRQVSLEKLVILEGIAERNVELTQIDDENFHNVTDHDVPIY